MNWFAKNSKFKRCNITKLMFVCMLGILFSPIDVLTAFAIGEPRALFDEDFFWITQKGTERLLSQTKRAGFNVLVPCVWHGRGTSWPSKLAPSEPLWDRNYIKGHDPLEYLIKRAHEMGLEVHPWFTVVLRQRDFLQEYYDDGTPDKSFDVHSPNFRRYIVEVILEVVRNYNVDGINLDYIRTMGFCKSKYCANDYRLKYQRELMTDVDTLRKSEAARKTLIEWNCNSVGEIVENVSREARLLKPGLIISVDSLAGDEGWLEQGADSISWANNGWIDVIYHMDYRKDINRAVLDKAFANLTDPDKLVLLVGNYESSPFDKNKVWPRDVKSVIDLVRISQHLRQNGNGVGLYEYRFLTDEQIEHLGAGPFKVPTKPDWKSGKYLINKH